MGKPFESPYIVPSWDKHDAKSMERPVSDSEGRVMDFWVKDVLPERRWAVVPETGKVMEQREFEDRYKQYLIGFGNLSDGDVICEPIPAADRFVNARRDHRGHIIPISYFNRRTGKYEAYNPDDVTYQPLDNGERYDPTRDRFFNVNEEKTKAQAAKMEKVEMLRGMFEDGSIDEATFALKVAELTAPEPAQEAAE